MSIFRSITREIENYGEDITVTSEKGQFTVKGILQPLLYKNKMYLGGIQVPSGCCDSGHYLLICPAKITLPNMGTVLFETKDKRFLLKRSETIKVNSKDLYLWAVLYVYREDEAKEEFDVG